MRMGARGKDWLRAGGASPVSYRHSFLVSFSVLCKIIFDKLEDLQTWPNHLSVWFLTRVRSSSYSLLIAWIFLRTSSLVTWSL